MSGAALVDVLYCAWNRRDFTVASFEQLLANTDWTEVGTLFVHDDGSTDGTRKHLRLATMGLDLPCPVVFHDKRLGSPVAVMNWYLDQPSEQAAFVKIDSDIIVAPGWLGDVLLTAHLNPGVDAIGIVAWEGPPKQPPQRREVLRNSHIGGVGYIHKRMFSQCRPVPRGRHGWTEHQTNHPFQTGFLKPDGVAFELDRLPVEPWVTHSTRYVAKGWAREWPKYAAESHAYWDWFTS